MSAPGELETIALTGTVFIILSYRLFDGVYVMTLIHTVIINFMGAILCRIRKNAASRYFRSIGDDTGVVYQGW